MVLLDSNIFIIDRFFPQDAVYPKNRAFVDQLASIDAAVSAFTLLEICGVAGFRLSVRELESWLFRFTNLYPVLVLDAFGLKGKDAEEWWSTFVIEVAETISRKMTLGDAVLLREAENYGPEAIITWNTKDFARRTRLPVLTPHSFYATSLGNPGDLTFPKIGFGEFAWTGLADDAPCGKSHNVDEPLVRPKAPFQK